MPDPESIVPLPSSTSPSWEEVEAELGQLVDHLHGAPLALPAADPATWDAVEQELGDLVIGFQDLQDDYNYRRAQEALGSLVQRLNLTTREQAGVEEALQNLRGLIDKLENTVVHIAAFGLVGRGKSSLLNALMGQEVFITGPTHGVTQVVEGSAWEVSRESLTGDIPDLLRASIKGLGQSRIELIDTPGLDEVAGEDRAALARRIAEQVDLILFVVAGDITRVEYEALQALRQASKPMLLVFNKVDQYPEADRQVIYETLRDRRLQDLISPDEIVMAAASPLAVEAVPQSEGQVTYKTVRGQPQVDDLKLKILDILHREGKALVALNTLMYAEGVSAEILERKRQICDRIADDTIWNATQIKAVAVALNPIIVADLVGGTIIDVMLILNLSRLYGLPMTRPAALKLLKQIALGLGGITVSELAITLGLSSLKGMLGVSAVATGGLAIAPYIPVAIAQGGVAGLATYGIGQIAKTYLTNGATWGPDGPRAVVSSILDSLDEASILNRIKTELRAKITSP
ncbi:GTP-binding protein [Nodosilinea sp. E11]|uniref:GTP-binding protein n=1 Tax=Nodosilinea sp. E11 TaxID=3037479 RepID=UPI00293491DD|nr:GTP-binding protein [Nodosilinea sp. E11]WOD39374.1 GTP-binding protein [Nodosilinea sp. E11]